MFVQLAATPPWREPGDPAREGDTSGRLRVFMDLEAVHWIGAVAVRGGATRVRSDAVGVLGRRRFAAGFGLGWGFGEHVIAGARGDFVVFPDRDATGVALLSRGGSFSGFVELLLLRRRHVRPYTMARAGLGGTTSFAYNDGSYSVPPRRALVPSVGLRLGTHAFVTEDFSLDVGVTLDHRWNMRANPGSTFETPSYTLRDSQLVLAGSVGFSRWF